ncbi:hypothetical protein HK096_006033 [Nowakowskiella sp. JEL0078]|nr:hypothetical protein HK096_006033 [Nowakowskiella sp. JEL0078]
MKLSNVITTHIFALFLGFTFANSCDRDTDTLCLNETSYAHCFPNNIIGPPMNCGTGTACKEYTVNGTKRVNCGWPSTSPKGPCNRLKVDTICLTKNTYAHCLDDNTLSEEHLCGAGTRCKQAVDLHITRVYCGYPHSTPQLAIRDESIEGQLAARSDQESSDGFRFPVNCDPKDIYSVCLNSTYYAQCLSTGRLSVGLQCGAGTVCKETSYSGVAGVFCDWPSSDGANTTTTKTKTTKETSYSTTTISTTSLISTTSQTTSSSSTSSVSSSPTPSNSAGNYHNVGDKCPEKTQGLCVGSTSFSLCDAGGYLSESTQCPASTVCRENMQENMKTVTCWWRNDSNTNNSKAPGDSCVYDDTDSTCISSNSYSQCFSSNLLGPEMKCGNDESCREVKNKGRTQVYCGHGKKLKRNNQISDDDLNELVKTAKPGSHCNLDSTYSICLDDTTWLQCWANSAFGPIQNCGSGTVCTHKFYEEKIGIYCGWPSPSSPKPPPAYTSPPTKTKKSTSTNDEQATTTSANPAPKLIKKEFNIGIAKSSGQQPSVVYSGDKCDVSAIDTLCLDNFNYAHCLGIGKLGDPMPCSAGTECTQFTDKNVLRVYCGPSYIDHSSKSQTSTVTYITRVSTVIMTITSPSTSSTSLSSTTFISLSSTSPQTSPRASSPTPQPPTYAHKVGDACNSNAITGVCVSQKSFSLCDSESGAFVSETFCGTGTVCVESTEKNKKSIYCGWPAKPIQSPIQNGPPTSCDIKTTNSLCLSKNSFALCNSNGSLEPETFCNKNLVCKSLTINKVARVLCAPA